MPRAPRVDAPGLFHHVVVRGVERRAIFVDDEDRRDFLHRLDRILPESGMPCLAWVLIPNHVHLLVRTVSVSISRVMARVGTGYARRFNERHGRVGHLFQNRFRSRPIDDEVDLRGVLRYVHLNPLKHDLVRGLEGRDGLEAFPWSGHLALLGAVAPRPFHDAAGALAAFDPDPARAREALRQEMCDGAAALAAASETADATAPHRLSRPLPPAPSQADALADLIGAVASALAVGPHEIASGGSARAVARARAIVAYRAHAELGIPVGRLVGALGVGESSLRRAIEAERRRRRPASLSLPAQNAGPSPDQ
jgi:REP element-mobilizing transposase RayT